jgi:hypothetical protein
MRLTVEYAVHEEVGDFHFGFIIYRSTDNFIVYDGGIQGPEVGLDPVRPGQRFRLHYDFRAHLTRGQYHIECHVFHNPSQSYICKFSPAASFGIAESRTYAGVADVELACVPAVQATEHARQIRPASGW